MKILAIADEEAKCFYDYYTPGCLKGFDLIISCGDLKREYMEFLVTMSGCPLLYVHGNHDGDFARKAPEGCICIDDRLYIYNGVRIAGLGGSGKYSDGRFQYTERQMKMRILRLLPKLWKSKGIDILVTHTPPEGINDLPTRTHKGFACFHSLLKQYHPVYMLHGHVHLNYGRKLPRISQCGETKVINAYGYAVVEL